MQMRRLARGGEMGIFTQKMQNEKHRRLAKTGKHTQKSKKGHMSLLLL